MPAVRIGDILVRRELVDPNALRRALAEQASRGQRLVSMLITQTLIEFDDGALALSEQLDYPAVLERDFEARAPQLATLITPEHARAWTAIPIARGGDGSLIVAARDPSPALAAALREVVAMPVVLAVGPAIYLERIIRAVYKGPAESRPPELLPGDQAPPAGMARKTVSELVAGPQIAMTRATPRAISVGGAPRAEIVDQGSSRNETPTSPPPLGRTAASFDAPDDPSIPRTTHDAPSAKHVISRDQLRTKLPPLGVAARSFDVDDTPATSRTSSSGHFAAQARITTAIPRFDVEDTKPPPLGRTAASFDAAARQSSTDIPTVSTIPSADLVAEPMISTASTIGISPPRPITRDIEKALSKQTAERLAVKQLSETWRSALVVAVVDETVKPVRGHGPRLGVLDKLQLEFATCSLLSVARDTGSIAMTTLQDPDPLLDWVGLPAAAAPVVVAERIVAIIVGGEPLIDLAAAMSEVADMASALAGAYLRFK